jgi:hypothetical protein
MDRSGKLLTAALMRPMNLVAPGAGLLLALSPWGPWWAFPLSFLPYVIMVVLNLRDPSFVQGALQESSETEVGEPIDWGEIKEFSNVELASPLKRIADSEKRLSAELNAAPAGSRAVMASSLAQLRSAARLGIELARKVKMLDSTLSTYSAMNPQQSRWEAQERRRRAGEVKDEEAKRAFLDAAKSLDESAESAEALQKLRERTVAQLENLGASLESVAVRTIRLRVSADEGNAAEIGDTLRVDVEAVKETLGVFEEQHALEESARAAIAKEAK